MRLVVTLVQHHEQVDAGLVVHVLLVAVFCNDDLIDGVELLAAVHASHVSLVGVDIVVHNREPLLDGIEQASEEVRTLAHVLRSNDQFGLAFVNFQVVGDLSVIFGQVGPRESRFGVD